MAKISTLHINNFKFFGNTEEKDAIKVDGKHLLIYGENGSGKSSIYWALFTLLECSRKVEAGIKKYFNKNHKRSLVNTYAETISPDNWDSFIKATLDDSTEYRIAINDTEINTRIPARESNRASDFLTYRFAFKIHDFRHGEEIELFGLFFKEIFPYVFRDEVFEYEEYVDMRIRTTRYLDVAWKSFLANGLTRYPNAKKQRVRSDTARANGYKKLAKDFDTEVLRVLGDIVTFGNQVLEKLGYLDMKFALDYSSITFNSFGDAIKPTIKLRITEFAGKKDPFKFPQSYLNEARLTAIALAIRLGFLEGRLSEAELKLLVLDDLLISLDMSNRQTVLDLILDKYTYKSKDESADSPELVNVNRRKFQVIILTHDAQFNHFVKSQIKLRGKEFAADWKYVDMYEHVENGVKNAMVVNNESHLEKARQYFFSKRPDYEAAGNCLRKEAEEFTKSFLPNRQQVGKNLSLLDLSGRIQKSIEYAKNNGLDVIPFNALNQHREFIFNALSHDAYDVPRFRSEIGKCFKTFDEDLYQIKRRQVLDNEEQLAIELHDGAHLWRAVITIYEPLVLIKEPTKDSILAKVFANYQIYKDGAKHGKNCPEVLSIHKFYEKWYSTSNKSKSADFWEEVIISKTGEKLNTLRIF